MMGIVGFDGSRGKSVEHSAEAFGMKDCFMRYRYRYMIWEI